MAGRQRLITATFHLAVTDYLWLLERGYPEKRSRHLVSDRYGLSRSQRSAMLRGVFPAEVNRRRSSKRIDSAADLPLLSVDGTNVLATICNYLYGRTLFISSDGYLRDDGENYPSGCGEKMLQRAVHLLSAHLEARPPQELHIYLDISSAPSTAPPEILEPIVRAHCATAPGFQLRPSSRTDRELTALRRGALAGTDSGIIDRSPLPVYDAAHETLREAFSPDLADLRPLCM
jgi:hypothetical protein